MHSERKLGLRVNSEFINGDLILSKSKNLNISKTIDLLNTPDLYQPINCTFFGLGYLTKFPGTLCSFVSLFLIWLIKHKFSVEI